MTVIPRFGVVPVGGSVALKVEMYPFDLIKFDARIMVQIRGGKLLELRLIGESEEPNVTINMVRTEFFFFFAYFLFKIARF